jgi:hypothetical protein
MRRGTETDPRAEFIEEIEAGGILEADARGLTLVVSPVQEELAIDADRQVLAGGRRESRAERVQVHPIAQYGDAQSSCQC